MDVGLCIQNAQGLTVPDKRLVLWVIIPDTVGVAPTAVDQLVRSACRRSRPTDLIRGGYPPLASILVAANHVRRCGVSLYHPRPLAERFLLGREAGALCNEVVVVAILPDGAREVDGAIVGLSVI